MFPATFAVAPKDAETVASRNQRRARESRTSESRASQGTESSHGDQASLLNKTTTPQTKWWKAPTFLGNNSGPNKSPITTPDGGSLQQVESQASKDCDENSAEIPKDSEPKSRSPSTTRLPKTTNAPLSGTLKDDGDKLLWSQERPTAEANLSRPRRPLDISAPLPPLPLASRSPESASVSSQSLIMDGNSGSSSESQSSRDSEAYLSLNERIAHLEFKLHRQPSLQMEEPAVHFAKFFGGIANSRTSVIANRLSESLESSMDQQDSDSLTDRLWTLIAYERLFQGRQVQKHIHEMLQSNTIKGGRRLLNLYGGLADGWLLAERYPLTTIYTVTNQNIEEPSSLLAPPNHHSLYVPAERPKLPFGSSFFNVVVSRTLATSVTEDLWPLLLREALRVMKPSGLIEHLVVDPRLDCEGELLKTWARTKLLAELESNSMCTSPSSTVLEHAKAAGFCDLQRVRIALPVMMTQQTETGLLPELDDDPGDAAELIRMMTLMGRAFYKSSYASFTRSQSHFWFDRRIGSECREKQARIVLSIICGRKGART